MAAKAKQQVNILVNVTWLVLNCETHVCLAIHGSNSPLTYVKNDGPDMAKAYPVFLCGDDGCEADGFYEYKRPDNQFIQYVMRKEQVT